MRSIYSRLTAYLLVGTTLLLFVAGVFFDFAIRAQLEREFDHALLAKAQTLVTLTTQEGGEIELDFADEFMPEFEARENPEYFQLWLADGTLIERSRSLGSHDLSLTGFSSSCRSLTCGIKTISTNLPARPFSSRYSLNVGSLRGGLVRERSCEPRERDRSISAPSASQS